MDESPQEAPDFAYPAAQSVRTRQQGQVSLMDLIMASQNTQATMTGFSGDYAGGRDRLQRFIAQLRDSGLLFRSQMADAEASANALLRPADQSFVIEISGDQNSRVEYVNQCAMLARNIDATIENSLKDFAALKAAGRMNEVYRQLGVTVPAERWQSHVTPDTTTRIERPGSVTVVCVIQIIVSAILTLVTLYAFSLVPSGQLTGGIIALSLVNSLLPLAVAIGMLMGSRVARILFVILFVVLIVSLIAQMPATMSAPTLIGLLIRIACLVGVFTSDANEYFAG